MKRAGRVLFAALLATFLLFPIPASSEERQMPGSKASVKTMFLSVVMVFLVLLASYTTAAAEKLRACYPAIAGNIAPLWIAKEKGFFARQGLDVDLTFIRGGTTAVAVMLSREATFCMIAGPGLILSHLSGSDLVMVAGITNTFDFTVFGAKGIQKIEELRGKKAAVSRFGSASDFAIRYILQRHGLRAGQDVTILQIGDNNVEGIAGLETGTIQATPINPPMSLVAREKGFPELADLGKLGIEYQHVGLVASQAYLKDNREQARRFIRAFMEALRFYQTQKDESIQVVAKYAKIKDQKLLQETYAKYLELIPRKPYPTLKGLEFILTELARNDPRAKGVDPKEFVDMSFVKELDASGFFDR